MTDKPTIMDDYEARLCPGIPTDCCDYGVISHATGIEVCRVWQEDDARLIASLLNESREAAVAELQVEVERLREALQMAAKQFRFYEESHLLKETTDGIAKAVANRRCAEQCEIALAQKELVE